MRGLGPFPRDAWRLARPYFTQAGERRTGIALLAAIVFLNLALVGMTVIFNFWNRVFYNAIQDKDWPAFVGLLLTWRDDKDGFMPGFAALAFVYVVIAVYRRYLTQWLEIRWRHWMTEQYIERWLGVNLVHGDLSPYNILYWKGRCVAIDFPQAVDPRFNDAARSLLERDISNLAKYFARMGVKLDRFGDASAALGEI